MSWMKNDKGMAGQTALAAAASPAGVLANDSKELEKIRALGMSPRQLWLNHLWSRFITCQYDARGVEWDGSEAMSAVDRETMASSGSIPAGFHAAAESMPLKLRKPSAPYHIFRVIVTRFSDLLFAESRHPRVVCPGDPDKENFANGLIEQTRLWSVMGEARNYGGSCGGVPVAFSFVDGKAVVEVLEPFYCFPKFKSRTTMTLSKIEVRWLYPVEERDDHGKWVMRSYWYRRIIDDKSDAVWEQVLAPTMKDGSGVGEPDWDAPENAPVVVNHGFGFCPVRWIQNTKVQGQPEGEHDCTGALEMIDRLDHLLAQGLQGVDLNCDPTLLFENIEDSEIPPLKKGSSAAIKLPKGTASYLELAGSGPKTAMDWVQQLRSWILEMCQCVLEDAGDTPGGDAVTATEIRKRYASMYARSGKLREQYGQNGFLPLLEDIIKAARKLSTARPATPEDGTDAGMVTSSISVPPKAERDEATGEMVLTPRSLPAQDSGVQLTAIWPEWTDPTPQDATAAVTAAGQAVSLGLLDLEHAVNYIATYFKVEDTAALIQQLKVAKQQADEQQQQMLMAGMLPPGDPNAGQGDQQPPPDDSSQPPTQLQ